MGKDGKSGNNQNWAFMIISAHFKPIWWERNQEKNGKIKIWHSQLFLTILVVKDRKKCEMTKIGHSESFQTNLVGKDGEKCKMTKIGHSKSF